MSRAIAGVDVVFHCATATPTGENAINRQLMQSVNVDGTQNVIAACVQHKVKHLVSGRRLGGGGRARRALFSRVAEVFVPRCSPCFERPARDAGSASHRPDSARACMWRFAAFPTPAPARSRAALHPSPASAPPAHRPRSHPHAQVFTSSASVVFDGKPLHTVTEDQPYAAKPMDYYTQTKVKGLAARDPS